MQKSEAARSRFSNASFHSLPYHQLYVVVLVPVYGFVVVLAVVPLDDVVVRVPVYGFVVVRLVVPLEYEVV